MKNLWKNKNFTIIAIIALLLVIPLSLYLTKQRQEIRKKAQGTGEIEISLSSNINTANIEKLSSFDVSVVLKSPAGGQNIAGGQVKLSYDKNFFTIDPANIVCSSSFPLIGARSVDDNYIRIICAREMVSSSYSMPANTPVILATFRVSVKDIAGKTTISFPSGGSKVTDAATASDLSNAGTTATYTIGSVATPTPLPTPPPQPPGHCDQFCNTTTDKCGYRNGSGVCVSDSACCHRECVANGDCEMVWDSTNLIIERNQCDVNTPQYPNREAEHCILTCDTSCPGVCAAKMKTKWDIDTVLGHNTFCTTSNNNPNCCAVTNTPVPTRPVPTSTPKPILTPTPQPPGTCDQSCNTAADKCGYRNGSGVCVSDSACCHRVCTGNAKCEMVWDGTKNSIERNQCDVNTPQYPNREAEHCILTCDTSCPGICAAKMTTKWDIDPTPGHNTFCTTSASNPNCCAVTNTPIPTSTPVPTSTPGLAGCANGAPDYNKGNISCDMQGLIDESDFGILMKKWHTTIGTPVPTPNPGNGNADFVGNDGLVDESEFGQMLKYWRTGI